MKVNIVDKQKEREAVVGDALLIWDHGKNKKVRLIVSTGSQIYGLALDGRTMYVGESVEELVAEYKNTYDNVVVVPSEQISITVDV